MLAKSARPNSQEFIIYVLEHMSIITNIKSLNLILFAMKYFQFIFKKTNYF